MYVIQIVIATLAFAVAGPVPEPEAAPHELAKPFINHVFPFPRNPTSAFSLFRRQGDCPILTLVCPSGICCSYDTPCCGHTCCDSNSVCAGTDSSGSPCCVAIGASSNTCGSSNSNPCANYPGTLPCSNIDACCPPNSICYYDSNNYPRCSPQGSDNPPASSSYIPIPSFSATSPILVAPVSSYSTTSSSFSQISPTPTPDFSTGGSGSGAGHTSSDNSKSHFWTAAAIGGIAGGSGAFLVLVGLIIWFCVKKPRPEESTSGYSESEGKPGNLSGGKSQRQSESISKQPRQPTPPLISSVVPPLEEHSKTHNREHDQQGVSEPIGEDLPRDEGGYDSANLAADDLARLAGTDIYDPVMIQPTGPPSKEEIDRRRAKQAEVNQANADLYQPNIALEKDRGNIRILIIEPSEDRNAPLICRLGRIFLHGGGYEALSYKWGLPFYRSEIMINGFAFSVTTELESTLRHLRYTDPEHERWIWIDAICINQIDENEKRWQLELMRDVYHNAKRTLIWLGKGTQKSNKAIDFFNKRGRCHATIASLLKDYESNEPNKESWRCLQDILEREWWSRLWIVQEVIVSRDALILCGDRSIAFPVIPKMLGIAIKNNLDIFSYSTFISQYRRNINLLQHYRLRWQEGQSLSFEWWVRLFGFKHGCENPKDKIRSLLALSGDERDPAGDGEIAELFRLNQNASDCEWYTTAATHIISWRSQQSTNKDIDFICLDRGARRNQNFVGNGPNLPSWVPDLTLAPWESYPTLTRKSWLSKLPREGRGKEDNFHASNPRELQTQPIGIIEFFGMPATMVGIKDEGVSSEVKFSKTTRGLKVTGVIVDKVEVLGQEYDLNLTPENLEQGTLTHSQLDHHRKILTEMRQLIKKAKETHGEKYIRGNCTYDRAMSRALVCDRNAKNERLTDDEVGFKDFESGGNDSLSAGKFDDHSMDQHFQRVHRRFMVSKQGHIGLVPPETQVGDVICVLYGCSVPVILRQWNVHGEIRMCQEFIGECYVHGIMDGEVVLDVAAGRACPEDFNIE